MGVLEDFVTVKEYAKLIGSSEKVIRRLLIQDRIPGAVKMGRDWLIPADAIPIPGKKGPAAQWEKKLDQR